MESSTTELYLPSSFPYPIKVVSIDANSPTSIERGTRLLSYSFVRLPSTPDGQPETRFGTWDSAIEGKVESWKVKRGDVISQRKAKDHPVVRVCEPCKHGMQISGLCVYCGKDMTKYVAYLYGDIFEPMDFQF
jgi:RNA polymerase II subunit A-like phosphatase